ncbi:conserved hypothetical protein [Theileria orientalis strain Shintoku]|uniref:Uncharacterized protein n=1 Tax=Theileria orientalis strain Shintoku TaxID=869250 RepID=J4C2T3_THEOR|nr:conserved hypothetical protein [Theileria orientalis strain Shintoku]BAM39241.1 conserved hypothetical protein [Theileria orientalis strain Shintoku]|eukprot:XP_009689542.1 conserved hypothetical protein [Theileria orientalis strain Shintoku]
MNVCIVIAISIIRICAIRPINGADVHRDGLKISVYLPISCFNFSGPVGLPGHVRLRNSDVHIKRRKHSITNSHSPEVDQFNAQIATDIGRSTGTMKQMSELAANNHEYSILGVDSADYNYDFNFIPEWFNTLPPSMNTPKEFVLDSLSSLAHMGLMSLISSDVFSNAYCSVFSSEEEKLVCLKNSVETINKIAQTGMLITHMLLSGKQIMSLNFRVLVGGRTAKEALVSLNTLASNPDNVGLIKTLGSTIVMYITLMRELVGDESKALAGSVITKLTDLPVASNVADISTGGFGRVNVILPRPSRLHRADYDIAKLKAGASEKELLTSA